MSGEHVDLDTVKTVDLINVLIQRQISVHEYELIYNNHLREALRKYREQEEERLTAWRREQEAKTE